MLNWYRASQSLRVFLLYPPGPGPMFMSALRRRWTTFRNPHVDLRFIGPVYLGPGFSLDAPRGGTFIAGPGCEFRRNFRVELAEPTARVEFGAMCVCTYDVVIHCRSSITVGNYSTFGQAALIVDNQHNFRDPTLPMIEQGYTLSPITISDYVTTTTKCTIMADIGTRTVVGANSVVSRPLPDRCLAVGAPARVIEYFDESNRSAGKVDGAASRI